MAPALAQREHLLHVLPAEAVGLILEMLAFRDLIALRMTCKALSSWSQYATRIQAIFHVPLDGGPSMKSLSRYLQGPQCVRRLGLQIEAGRHATCTDLENQFQDLAQILHLCSPTLQVLRLRLLQATNYRDYEMDALDPSQLEAILDSISACKQLHMLYISTGLVPGLCGSTGDAITTFCANLPRLRTLQWRMATCGPERPNHFSPAFVMDVASKPAKGLQLLQVDNFTFEDHIPLPPALRYVAIGNEAFELLRPIGDLLNSCRSLEELYLTGHQCTDAHGPDMATLWPRAQRLEVLVLDVLQDVEHMPVRRAPAEVQTLPKLRILVIRHLCTVGHLLNVRCPDLHTMVLFVTSLAHTEFLETFLQQRHNKLGSLQLLFYNGARQSLQYRQFWCSVRPLQNLKTLQLVMSSTHADPVEEVCTLLGAAYCPDLLCLSQLSEIAVYIEGIFEESAPVHFFTGTVCSLSDSCNSAALVLNSIGQLASSGIFPALQKVSLYPCWDVGGNCPAFGLLPPPASAPHLICTALKDPGDRTGGAWGKGLRSMVGSSDEEAALRAIESLSVSYDVDEIL